MPLPAELVTEARALTHWLTGAAYPRWRAAGIDPATGGFVEAIGQDGVALTVPRRGRVPPRQVYSFAHAPRLGAALDPRPLMQAAFADYRRRYRRDDGFYRTLVAVDGRVLDDSVLLYDQAFVLLALAELTRLLPGHTEYAAEAVALRTLIETRLRSDGGAFLSAPGATSRVEANPHMHVLEACLGWTDVGGDARWAALAAEIVALARRLFIRGAHGALFEVVNADGSVPDGIDGRLIEPGHQFEWAWLLLRQGGDTDPRARDTALALIAVGERFGVQDGFAVAALREDGTVHDPVARLWPQTERLKAALAAHRVDGDAAHLDHALAAITALKRYLDTPLPGLWWDARRADGSLADGPAPASSFYHLVCAIHSLHHAV